MIKVVDAESLMPAKYPVAYSDKSIAILNALHVNSYNGRVMYPDSLLTNMVAKGLKHGMEASSIFHGYDIPVYNLSLFCNENQCDELSNTAYMNSIAEQTQAALLIVIDSVEIAQAERSIDQMYLDAYGKVFYATAYAPYKAVFRFYDLERQAYIVNYVANDTILWEAVAYKATEALAHLPEAASADTLAAQQIGKQMANATLPQWKSDRRYYYDLSGSNGYKATASAGKRDWKQAMYYWGQIAMEETGKTAAYAAFNMALGAEMLGDYPLAVEWLTLAKSKADFGEIDAYMNRLQRRIADKKVIEMQLEN
jgi:hypothetical protein